MARSIGTWTYSSSSPVASGTATRPLHRKSSGPRIITGNPMLVAIHESGRKNSRWRMVSPGARSGPFLRNSSWMPPRAQRARWVYIAESPSGARPRASRSLRYTVFQPRVSRTMLVRMSSVMESVGMPPICSSAVRRARLLLPQEKATPHPSRADMISEKKNSWSSACIWKIAEVGLHGIGVEEVVRHLHEPHRSGHGRTPRCAAGSRAARRSRRRRRARARCA